MERGDPPEQHTGATLANSLRTSQQIISVPSLDSPATPMG